MESASSDRPELDVKIYSKQNEDDTCIANGDGKWKGGVRARLLADATRVWEMVSDFGGVAKWSLLAESRIVEGEPNVGGCIRYCKSRSIGPDGENFWVKEKLLECNHESFTLSYAVVDGNMGWKGYAASLRISDITADACDVEWVFELDPLPAKDKKQQLVERISTVLASTLSHLHELLSKQP
ncbi:hypothetical protein KP509_35G067200 [Ceratopteris richardii]|nr:hypothetical protein KP509_35G067200 [Ceratopteris richardii]